MARTPPHRQKCVNSIKLDSSNPETSFSSHMRTSLFFYGAVHVGTLGQWMVTSFLLVVGGGQGVLVNFRVIGEGKV